MTYLADKDIRARLVDINFECRLGDYPFQPDRQIGPASVDIRIDTKFWKVKRAPGKWWRLGPFNRFGADNIIDLRHHDIHEAQPALHWQQVDLAVGETLILQPGESVMARTYEIFSMPVGLAGKFAARVSYSRLGLLIHCGNDFINPGWRGQHPLQLVNLSGLPIRIAPLFPVAQLTFVQLTQDSDQRYGPGERYWHDDGGPSKWWRDELVRELVDRHGQDNLPRAVSNQLNQAIRDELFTDDQLLRLVSFRDSLAPSRFTTGVDLLTEFARREGRSHKLRRFSRTTMAAVSGLLWTTAIASLFAQPYGWLHVVFFVLSVLSSPFAITAAWRGPLDRPFLTSDSERYQRELRTRNSTRRDDE